LLALIANTMIVPVLPALRSRPSREMKNENKGLSEKHGIQE
jgi:hypothetical protein